MPSATAPSAFANVLSNPLSRAACTGGVGKGVEGSVILRYSCFALSIAVFVEEGILETAPWRGIKGWISGGIEDEPKNEEPKRGFLFDERDLSRSRTNCQHEHGTVRLRITINPGLDGFLNRNLKYLTLSPNLNNTSELLLNFICCTFVSYSGGFCYNLEK
jgi:hypothetical protein